jgi:uncharacterized protein (TIGR02145 family)
MKAIVNSSVKTSWFKASVAFLIGLLFLSFPACQKDEFDQDPKLNLDNITPSGSSNKVKLTGKVKDVDGNWYKTVKIGDQWWMAENLKTTRYRNHDLIGTTNPATLDLTGQSTPKYQWACDGIESTVATYGRVYTWYAVTDNRNVCPSGWHVPTDAEWTILTDYLGGEVGAGGKLKEAGYDHWVFPGYGFPEATNESGFTALPSSRRGADGAFSSFGALCFYWSSTESTELGVYVRILLNVSNDVDRIDYEPKSWGNPVRCVKDK